MRKDFLKFLAGIIACSLLFTNVIPAANQNDIQVKIDGVTLKSDVPPVKINDRLLVSVNALAEKLGASAKWNEKTQKVSITLNNMNIEMKVGDTNVLVNGKSEKIDEPAKLINKKVMVPVRFVCEQFNMKVVWTASKKLMTINHSELKNVKCTKVNNKASLSVTLDYFKNYNISHLTNPERLVIDFPNVKAPTSQKTIEVNNGIVKRIRYAHFKDTKNKLDTARVVLELTGQSKYQVKKTNTELIMDLETTKVEASKTSSQNVNNTKAYSLNVFKNITYENKGDRVALFLKGVLLNEVGENYKKFYRESYDNKNKTYTITFSQNLGSIGTGKKVINDNVLSYIEVKADSKKRETSIIFKAKDNFFYEVVARPDNKVNDTAITILKPAKKGEKLIVIDPGHGGVETGSIVENTYEKNLNLDIALRLKKLLNSKNIKSYLTRQDDSFVGLYERAYIANDLNAKLFVCIHNNGSEISKSVNGTETLYYPNGSKNNGFSGQDFAKIIQNNLVKKLGTANRGIIERPNLVVLKATKMPSVLAEVGYMTNKNEFNKLSTPDFRQKAAQALCDSIVSALNKIK
jgi:N-acetylmuramoyl-L-alanine amidase